MFINRNFIRTVNRASDKMVSQSERLVSVVKERVIKNHHTDDSDEEADEEHIDDAIRRAASGAVAGGAGGCGRETDIYADTACG